jgi:hypothetical protein
MPRNDALSLGSGLFSAPRGRKNNPLGLPGISGAASSGGRKPIPKDVRNLVWRKYIGNKPEGKCYCCRQRTISFDDFQVGHNKAVVKGGSNNISNLRPICGPCNRGMGTGTIESYRRKHFGGAISGAKKKVSSPSKRRRRELSPLGLPVGGILGGGGRRPRNPYGF